MAPTKSGVHTIALDDGRRVVVWYPADDSAADQPKESFDIASLLSPELQAKLTPEQRPLYEIDAHPGGRAVHRGSVPGGALQPRVAGFPELSAS